MSGLNVANIARTIWEANKTVPDILKQHVVSYDVVLAENEEEKGEAFNLCEGVFHC